MGLLYAVNCKDAGSTYYTTLAHIDICSVVRDIRDKGLILPSG